MSEIKTTLKRIVSVSAAAVCLFSALNLPSPDAKNVTAADVMTAFEITEDMQIGWNLGNTLDANTTGRGLDSETSWGCPKATQELMNAIKAKGFNTVRIPTTWFNHVDGDFNIDSQWMARVKEVVDYCYKNDMYVILNVHHEEWINRADFGSAYNEMSTKLKKLWTQIATEFASYDQHLIFEGMNEPRAAGTTYEWYGNIPQSEIDNINKLNKDFVDTVRSISSPYKDTRLLMIPPYCASSDSTRYSVLEIPDDDYVAVSIHAYSPYNFTMNAAVSDHSKFTGSYQSELDGILSGIQKTFIDKDIPVIIGEFGASNFNNTDARCEWAEYYINTTKKYGIPCVLWDNNTVTNEKDPGECHGYIDRSSCQWYSVSEPVIDSMMKVINDDSIVWGSEGKSPVYTHQDMSEGKVLYSNATGQSLDASVKDGNCSDNYAVTLADLDGKDIAVKYTGSEPVGAFMDGDWKNWTEFGAYEVDSDNGIAYFSGASIAKAWSAASTPEHLCFRTNGQTVITGISIIDAASAEIPDPIDKTLKYPIEFGDADRNGTLVISVKGAAGTEANGCVGFMTEEWNQIEWEGKLNDGTYTLEVPMSKFPADVTSAQFQIWWYSNDDIKMDSYKFVSAEQPTTTTTTQPQPTGGNVVYGDANDDGEVSVSDAIFVLQSLADPQNSKYKRTAQGDLAADCYNPGSGVDAEDALAIQLFIADLGALPVVK